MKNRNDEGKPRLPLIIFKQVINWMYRIADSGGARNCKLARKNRDGRDRNRASVWSAASPRRFAFE